MRNGVGSRSVAYWLATALGRCRLFGVRVAGGEDFTLTPEGFERAASYLVRHVADALFASMTEKPGRVLAEAHSAFTAGHLGMDLLELRMDAHAAHLALDEAYAAAVHEGSPEVSGISRRLGQVRRVINLFDKNLQNNLSLLRPAASTYLLDNWRRLLAPTYRDCPPWWLDGCIG